MPHCDPAINSCSTGPDLRIASECEGHMELLCERVTWFLTWGPTWGAEVFTEVGAKLWS